MDVFQEQQPIIDSANDTVTFALRNRTYQVSIQVGRTDGLQLTEHDARLAMSEAIQMVRTVRRYGAR